MSSSSVPSISTLVAAAAGIAISALAITAWRNKQGGSAASSSCCSSSKSCCSAESKQADSASAKAAPAPAAVAVAVPAGGVPGTNDERTFIAVKPDAVQRNLIGTLIQRFERKGFKLVALKMVWPDQAKAEGHYADLAAKSFFKGLVKFFSSGPIVAMVWQGRDAIKTGRKLLGETNPAASLPGSARGDLSVDVGRNIIHGSDGPESAAHEISFWFSDAELINWQPAASKWIYEKP